jgi:hypothetical protein
MEDLPYRRAQWFGGLYLELLKEGLLVSRLAELFP